MDKFIFVCYDHGCGGENLSVQISKRDYCNKLEYTTHGTRTWSMDVFNKLFLKKTSRHNWDQQLPEIPRGDCFDVVPSHVEPSELKRVFPKSIYVVINFPQSKESRLHLRNRIYEKVWLSSHTSMKQKIGFCVENGYKIDSQKKLTKINTAVNNAHIHCIMNDLDFTEENVEYLLSNKLQSRGMYYIDDHQTITLEYNKIDFKKLDRLDELCVLHR